LRKTARLAFTFICLSVLSFIIFIHPASSPAMALESDVTLDLSMVTSAVEAGAASHSIGYVRLFDNSTGEPVLAASNIEVSLLSGDASIAFVPSRVMIPAGSDYARFDVEVSDFAGDTEISAAYGGQTVTREFRVVDAVSLIENVDLVINLASDMMQVASEMPFSVYLESSGSIMQAPEDIMVKLEYEKSLVELSSSSIVIKKGSYYALGTISTLEKSGNAFIKATSDAGIEGHLLTTVTNVEISQTQPVSLRVHVFPEQVGLDENTIDIFVGVLDAAGQPTLAAEDIELELFSSAYQLSSINSASAVIKKGEFGFYTRQYMNFYSAQNVTIGASSSGLGAGTDTFEVLEESIGPTHAKALDRALNVFVIPDMPSDAESIAAYQISVIEHDDDDCVEEDGTIVSGATLGEVEESEGEEGDHDHGSEMNCVDVNGDGNLSGADWHPIDELAEGELYPLDSDSIFSQTQGNLHIVSGDNMAARIFDHGYIASGSSYGTATIVSGRQADDVDISVSLSNFAVGSNTLAVVGGLNPTQTRIFSPGGMADDGNYRVVFDHEGLTDLFFVTLDSAGRPSNSQQGVKYLVKPVNVLTEINPGKSFAHLHVEIDSFRADGVVAENTVEPVTAVPVGVNSDSALEGVSDMHMLFHTGTASKVMLPFESTVAFSKAHPIGVVQLQDVSGNPVLASDNVTISLTSSSLSNVLPSLEVVIPAGKSFVGFDILTFGRADNFTIYATADGLQSSSVMLAPMVAELPASFVGSGNFATSVPAEVMLTTPIGGASVSWGASSGLQLLGNSTALTPAGSSYVAKMQVMSEVPGTFTVDATLLKDGFKPTRISKELVIGPYQREMSAALVDVGISMLAYNQPVQMSVLVQDAAGVAISGATVEVEDSGPQGVVLVSSMTTDAEGMASFVYTPTNMDQSSQSLTLMVTAYKDGYQPSRDSKVFEIDGSATILPPIPVIGTAFAGMPSWTSYAILGGAVAVGSGAYMLKKPKIIGDEDESLVSEDAAPAVEEAEQTPELVEESLEDEEEEEEI
jgi:hypothetical protein